MKLLSCYIENYGKIKKREFDFNTDLTSFCEENGFGKSTLASFIKAMFYGLEPYRSNTKDFCERMHFCPFDGGKFGGNLTFEAGGKVYKIERFFGEKSDTLDECAVYTGGKRTAEFGNEIGRAVFGIDAKSFERTAFIGSDEIEISSTTSINAKLNNFIEGDEGLDNALKILDGKRKEYKKSRAGNDAVTQVKGEIENLNYAITNAGNIKAALSAKYEKHSEIREEISSLEKQAEKAQTANAVLKDWERYDGFIQDIHSDEAKVKEIENGYPFGLPELEKTERVTVLLEREAELKAKLSQRIFDETDEAKLARLNERFSGGTPSEERLKETEMDIGAHAALETEINLVKDKPLSEKELKLRRTFAAGAPSEKETDAVRKKAEQLKEAEREFNLIPASAAPQTERVKKNRLFLVFAILSALAVAAGTGVAFVQLTAGIVLAAVGAVCLLADGFLYLNKKFTKVSYMTDSPERSALAQKIAELSDGIKAFLMPYGYFSGNGVAFDFLTFEEDLKVFNEGMAAKKEESEKFAVKCAERDGLEERLNAFFGEYGYRDGFLANLARLRGDIAEHNAFLERKRKSALNSGEIENRIRENGAAVTAFCKTYRMEREGLREKIKTCAEDVKTLAVLREKIAQTKARAELFKTERNLTERPQGGQTGLEEINARLNALRDEANRLYREICDDEAQAEKLDGYIADKSAAEERLDGYNKKYGLLSACIDCLKSAEENLKEKYVKPVRDKFIDYSELLEKTLGEKITMNRDFEISFERSGKERSEKHLSTGQRTICAFCFRLALIWNMYEGEKPFLILDDPFVSLDGQHLEKVKTLLKELSKKMQIVYFSCHESRAV